MTKLKGILEKQTFLSALVFTSMKFKSDKIYEQLGEIIGLQETSLRRVTLRNCQILPEKIDIIKRQLPSRLEIKDICFKVQVSSKFNVRSMYQAMYQLLKSNKVHILFNPIYKVSARERAKLER